MPAGSSTAATPTLIVREGLDAGKRYPISSELVVGREAADVTIPDPEVSRRHATIRPTNGALEIRDLGSENGTRVNGARIQAPTILKAGDTISIGRTEFLVESLPRGQATTRVPSPARKSMLRFRDGSLAGQQFPVSSECVLGRQGADIIVEDPGVSRRHAAVCQTSGELEVRDLQSSNGTWVNGDRVEGSRRVVPGDVIKVGNTTIEVGALGDSQATERA